ncbi:MAG: hypothetical protein KC621_21810, partial [Myxococcales bacterium]|nr:hypothetical protein [Myxococcales bacterium]
MNRRTLLLSGAALMCLGASERKTYLRAHREWTRKLVLYHDFGTALMMRATLLEPAFRTLLAHERRRLLDPSEENHQAFVERMERDGAAYVEIVFAADSGFDNGHRFGPGDDRWNLRCEADGVDQPLVAVEQVRKPSPLHDTLYVQHDQWSELWIARFERTVPSPRSVVLHVGGGYGNGTCTWDLHPSRRGALPPS